MLFTCHSYYSLRYGTLSIDTLVKQAKAHGIESLALTDIHNLSAMYSFIEACKLADIKSLIGMEFRDLDNSVLYTAIVEAPKGLAALNKFSSQYNKTKERYPKAAPCLEGVSFVYPLENVPKVLSSREYVGIASHQVNQLYKQELLTLRTKMILYHRINHEGEVDYQLHKILRAIDKNTLLSKLEEDDLARPNEVFVSPQRIYTAFSAYPDILEQTQSFVANNSFNFELNKPKNKQFFTKDKASDTILLSQLAHEGRKRIYGVENTSAEERVNRELKVIDQMNFSGYFLITWDIVQYSIKMNFMHIGRGSGANSIVGYCLGITNVCPLELDLYFERFLNENRTSPPDFDIDWSWKDRDVILDYIFTRYGEDHVAFCGAISTFKYRSIVREIGKVYGLPKEELAQLTQKNFGGIQVGSIIDSIRYFGEMLAFFPNRRTMHPCGVLISEEPITNYVPMDYPPKGYGVAQVDMHTAELIGYDKFDILSQRGLGHIEEAVRLIKENQNIDVDITDVRLSKDEVKANAYLKVGNTIGCFYIESPAMRGLLRRLQCDNYKTLVAASSIIRPGVAQSGMMQEYIYRHNNPTRFEYYHPVFEEQLGETYGIMVYQEDVIKIALHYAGLSAADGDILRRAMSGKGRSESALLAIQERFFTYSRQKGHPEELSREIYRQISSFAGYSFCKAHSASYAIESYQSLYLKAYYPLEFITAVINNQGGFYRTEVYVHEAKMAGAIVKPPCVNGSNYETQLFGQELYLGLMFIQSLSKEDMQSILAERERSGAFQSLEDFMLRIHLGMTTLQHLIFVGAFNFTGKQKNELLIQAKLHVKQVPSKATYSLFQTPAKAYTFPLLHRSVFEDAFDELELLGFFVSCSPFAVLKTSYRGDVMASDLASYSGKQVKMLGYLIARKHVPTSKGEMYFGTWIDAEGKYFDTVHFSKVLEDYPFLGGGCYLLLGTVGVEYYTPAVEVLKMAKLPFIDDPRYHVNDDSRKVIQQNIREDVSLTNRLPYPKETAINLPRYRTKF